jgi:two-component system chemotaxis sensor kinase CheA
LSGEIERATDTLERITGEMQQAIMQTRMVPIAVLFRKFPRLVRDLTRKLGKAAELEVAGEETEIDRTIVEALSDPLTHVVRNSLDHGLETPEERRGLGKSEVGRIRLSAQQQGGKIVIEVEDDGRGLDLERIRRKAGLPAEASKEQVTEVVFRPGFSTKEDVTDLSGRGVGLDVVATRIRDELKGDVELHSEEGRGTMIRLLLPLTLTILHSLVVRADRYHYAIPIRDIQETVKVAAADRRHSPEGPRYSHQGADIPLLRLAALLQGATESAGDEAGPGGGDAAGVVLQQRDRRVCLIVDELVEEQDVVIKPVSDLLNSRRLFSGTSVLGDGTVLFILDTGRIVDAGGSGG